MARKTLADLKRPIPAGAVSRHEKSWAALGWDTSMTSVACVGIGYDCVLDKMVGAAYIETRWVPDDDYFYRLGQASNAHGAALSVLHDLGMPLPIHRVFHAFEEPVPFGMINSRGGKAQFKSAWIKQQCEVAGAVKGSLVKYGYKELHEINNSQWRKTLRTEGVTIAKGAEGKWDVKQWAIQAFGLPDFPDLVKSKTGAKIPRPESGFGAKAKAVQPSDVYDAAAVCAWMCDNLPDA